MLNGGVKTPRRGQRIYIIPNLSHLTLHLNNFDSLICSLRHSAGYALMHRREGESAVDNSWLSHVNLKHQENLVSFRKMSEAALSAIFGKVS